jgi:hypothetical protein
MKSDEEPTIGRVEIPERFRPTLNHEVSLKELPQHVQHIARRTIEQILDEDFPPSIWERIEDGFNKRVQALRTIAKWSAILAKVIYYYYRGDMKNILKIVVTVGSAWLVGKWPALAGLEIGGVGLPEILLAVAGVGAALVFPSMREEVPEAAKQIFGWDKKDPSKGA